MVTSHFFQTIMPVKAFPTRFYPPGASAKAETPTLQKMFDSTLSLVGWMVLR
ncbi:hypothetical protein SAMN02745216_04936 [Desulfatibacillum alkenivorans DSM 16219]|jgi:hypothetical protein|uniref:Uncharacterized protein n=1 Tax=Desulfatibacillum alkenivorans DSM 16219 TaxID=1121393 RepID=A0A1M6ZAK4_9BACT|nr:hypothetical protein SAMN02745216_04936 [Desulfatibacillum alkenivorans DSM 16219]